MLNKVPIRKVDANAEILARIIKSVSQKYECSLKIDFADGKRVVEFIGDDQCKAWIAEEVEAIFKKTMEHSNN